MRPALATLALALVLSGCISIRGNVHSEVNIVTPTGKLRHVVFIKFNPTATAADIALVENGMQDLADEIDVIEGFEWGTEVTGRGLNMEFTHAAIFTFADKTALQTYIDHPAHTAFVDNMRPYVAELFVFDYIARE